MDKLKSIKNNIDLHINDCDFKSVIDRNRAKAWLEGWICGVTDVELHPEISNLRDEAMDYLLTTYQSKVEKINETM